MLASASSALIHPVLSEDGQRSQSAEVEAGLKPELVVGFRNAVQNAVLAHLNAKVPLPDRFSRVLRPMPTQYYDCELVGIGDDDAVAFRLVHWDRSQPGKPVRTVITTGKCNHATGEVLLKASPDGGLVPAMRHPLLVGKPNT